MIENSNIYKYKVGIYLRLSNEDKIKTNKDDISESIKNQRNMLVDYINKHSEFILIDEYVDEDLSGAGTYRPEFERLIKDCENKKIDVVLCKSQSRFSRDMEIVEKYINNKFKEWNIRFIGLADNADTLVLGNKKARQINGLVNEWYLEDVSNNIKGAFNAKMKQGEFISPFAVFGYMIDPHDNNKLIVDEVAAITIKEIYNLYLTGLGFTSIAKYLNNKNIPSPSLYKYQNKSKLNIVSNRAREEIKWSANAIKSILTNEVYLGNLVQGKRTTVSYKNHKIIKKDKKMWIKVENTHEAIIDNNIFYKVQDIIKKRTKVMSKSGLAHVFSGKVYCLMCKHYMRKKNSLKHEYLVCTNNRDGYDDCINKSGMRYDKLAVLVLQEINNLIKDNFDEKILKELYKNNSLNSKKIVILEKRLLDINNYISNIKTYIKNIYEDKVNGVITLEQFNYLMKRYNEDEEIYKNKICSISKEIIYYKRKDNDKDIFNKYRHFDKLNNIIIDEFIDKIYIGKKNNNYRDIHIVWKL